MSRRAKGEGSLFRRADGKYVGEVTVGHVLRVLPSGAHRMVPRRRRVVAATKSEAAARLQAMLRDEGFVGRSEARFDAFAMQWFTQNSERWRHSTYTLYRIILGKHIVPNFGGVPASRIDNPMVRRWLRKMAEDGIGIVMRKRAHQLAASIYQTLVDDGDAVANPFRAVRSLKAPRARITVPSLQQIKRLIDLSTDEQTRAIVVLAATTMLRSGELFALRYPEDVDLKRRRITVSGTLGRDAEGRLVKGLPKTASSHRTVALPAVAISAIEDHLRRRGKATGWLFTDSAGGPIDRRNFRNRVWKPLLRSARLPLDLHFHSLRHAGSSLLLDAGVPVLIVAARAGHSDTRMTLDRYGHIVRAGADQVAADATDTIFGKLDEESGDS